MKFKIKKIDKRYTGGLFFKYIAIPVPNPNKLQFSRKLEEEMTFFHARVWCWNTWGPSRELRFFRSNLDNRHLYDDENITDPIWGWETEHDKLRLYFKTDKETGWFALKWATV